MDVTKVLGAVVLGSPESSETINKVVVSVALAGSGLSVVKLFGVVVIGGSFISVDKIVAPVVLGYGSPAITTVCPLPPAVKGEAYELQFTAEGGSGFYTWSLLSGALPDGLTLSSDGLLSGTPTESGFFTIAVKVT